MPNALMSIMTIQYCYYYDTTRGLFIILTRDTLHCLNVFLAVLLFVLPQKTHLKTLQPYLKKYYNMDENDPLTK